jgi:aspartate/methionine/tyrosine aminotransferase
LEKDITGMNIRASAHSPYMQWAKLHSTATHNLATSGMMGLPLAELGVKIDQLEINGPTIYGYDVLLQALAQRYRVPQECVVSAMGTSFSNHLALAAATEPGDEILIELPTYDPILAVAKYLGLNVRRFQRRAEDNFAINLAEVEKNLTSRTRMIVLCNFHNPSGALTPDETLRGIANLARRSNAYVMVDEVYREMLYEANPQSSFHIDPEHFIVTNSLTKAYGLSGLRCGWILAPAQIAQRIWNLHDLHAATYPFIAEQLSVFALTQLPRIAEQMKAMLDENRRLLLAFLRERDDLEYFWPEYGTIVFPKLKNGSVEDLCKLLREQYEVSVVPGRFFDLPDHFRVGVGAATDTLKSDLRELAKGLDAYKQSLSTSSAEFAPAR